MIQTTSTHRGSTRSRALTGVVSARLRELAEAGAKGRSLSPVEVKEVCEALRSHHHRTPTRFHSGAAV